MPSFTLYNLKGESVGTVDQPALFQTPVDEKLIHRYFIWVRTMIRHTLAHTKNRGEVRGGGRKPWKQKGTGRARVGSSRSPLWRSGGTVFGPQKTQTWNTRMPRSERRKALFSALSSKALLNGICVLSEWEMKVPKTKEVITLLNALPDVVDKKVLYIGESFEPTIFKSIGNLPKIQAKTVAAVNIIDILNCDTILFTKNSLEALVNHFTTTDQEVTS